jgi:hypothetical protein
LQIGLIASGFAPMIYTALTAGNPTDGMPVAIISAIVALIAVVAALMAKETFKVPLDQLGARISTTTSPAASTTIASGARP